MNKGKLLVLVLGVLFAGAVNAQSSTSGPLGFDESMSASREGGERESYTDDFVCRAWTTCASGNTIACWSRGTHSCTWQTIPGVRVTCNGLGLDGTQSTFTEFCR